jgi:small-conductance mechanosensitive channel
LFKQFGFFLTYGYTEKLLLSIVALLVASGFVRLGFYFVDVLYKKKLALNMEEDQEYLANIIKIIKSVILYGAIALVVFAGTYIFNVTLIDQIKMKYFFMRLLQVFLIFVVAKLILSFFNALIDHLFINKETRTFFARHRRTKTLSALIKSVFMYVTYFIATVMSLELFNINTTSIIAGAGIVGLAVGFGAQNLVKDVITGFFILFEDQFTVGEYITTAGVTGVVEEVGLRTTKIREFAGQLHIIPNGEITKVTNFNRGQMLAILELGIPYEENLDQVLNIMKKTSEEMPGKVPILLGIPEVQGAVAFRENDVLVRIIAKTIAGEQWAAERELRKEFIEALLREGIALGVRRKIFVETKRDLQSKAEEGKSYGV